MLGKHSEQLTKVSWVTATSHAFSSSFDLGFSDLNMLIIKLLSSYLHNITILEYILIRKEMLNQIFQTKLSIIIMPSTSYKSKFIVLHPYISRFPMRSNWILLISSTDKNCFWKLVSETIFHIYVFENWNLT
jgi:hypothetical protein